MNALRSREKIHNVEHWMKSFLRAIGTLIEEDGEELMSNTMQPVQVEDFQQYLGSYVGDEAILSLLLDYDGTLSPLAPHPGLLPWSLRSVVTARTASNHVGKRPLPRLAPA